MRGKVVLALIIGIIILVVATIGIVSQKDDTKEPPALSINTQLIPCPLMADECVFSTIFETKSNNVSYVQLGHYNVASSSPVFAVFDGEVDFIDTKILNEKRVTIDNGQYTAVYRFVGLLPSKLERGSIKKGTVVGVLNQRISHFEKKYNFVFGILDNENKQLKKIEFNEDKSSFKIIN